MKRTPAGRSEGLQATIDVRVAGHRALVRRWHGPDTLLLHGFTGRAESWDGVASRLVERRAAAGGSRGRLVALDLPGHHPGAPVDRRGGFIGAAIRLARALVALDLASCQLVGYSMGARLGLGLMTAAPTAVRSAILIGVHTGLAGGDERDARRELEENWIEALRGGGTGRFVDAWERNPLFATQARLDAARRARQSALRRSHDPRGLAAAIALLGLAAMPDLAPPLARVRAPVSFLAGEDDPPFVRRARRAAAVAPGGRAVVVPGAGHNVPLEAPDAVADRVEEGIDDD